MPATLETPRLLLRPFTIDDAAAYWPLASSPAILRYTGDDAQTSLDAVRDILATRPLRDYAVHGYGRMACIEKSSSRLVGFCGLKYLDDLREVDIGFRFLPDCWGQGYATESAQVLIDHGRAVSGIGRIVGLVQAANGGSVRVLEKLGLRYERDLPMEDDGAVFKLYATPAGQP